jgi:hypothetical protein
VAKATEAGLAPTSESLTPESLFEHTTIAELAAALGHAKPDQSNSDEPVHSNSESDLSV